MGNVKGQPEALEEYTEATVAALPAVLDALDRYRQAVAVFNAARPNDLEGSLEDHSAAVESTVDRLAELDRVPAAFAGALRASDQATRLWYEGNLTLSVEDGSRFRADLQARLEHPDATEQELAEASDAIFVQTARFDERILDPHPVDRFSRFDQRSSMGNVATISVRTTVLVSRLHGRNRLLDSALAARPSQAAYHSDQLIRDLFTRAERRALATRARPIWNSNVAIARTQVEAARTALRTQQPITATGRALQATPYLGDALRVGGKTLGAVGIGFSAVDAVGDYQQGDYWGVGANALSAVGGGMMMFPATAPLGAALVVGSLIVEHRDAIGNWFSNAADDVGDWLGS